MLDELQHNLQRLSTSEKWNVLQLSVLFNCALGFGLFIGTLFIDSRIGGGASFQAVFTAIIHEAYSAYLLFRLKERDLRHADFLGGVMVMMNVLLLQTAALWGTFAGGLNLQPPGLCRVGGSTEKFISVIATLLFLTHVVFSGLIALWKNELLLSGVYKPYNQMDFENGQAMMTPESQGQYQNISASTNPTTTTSSSSTTITPANNHFVIQDDGDAEL